MKKRGIYFFIFLILSLSLISSAPTMENIGNKTFLAGESFSFGDNYVLYINVVDAGVKKANIILTEGGTTLFQKWFSEGSLLNKEGIITAHVYSITSGTPGGDAVLTLTDIVVIGKTAEEGPEPTTGNPEGECVESWICSLWNACSDGVQTRGCYDENDCGTTNDRPELTKDCIVQPLPGNECAENWQCSGWSDCIENQFTRTCIDLNNCGTADDKPTDSLACDPENPFNPDDVDNNPENSGGSSDGGNGFEKAFNYFIQKINPDYKTFSWEEPIIESGFWIIAFIILFLVFLLILLLLYIYISSRFSSIATKKNFSRPGIAWIPVVGPMIIASNLAGMHWWPILLLVFAPIKMIPRIFLSPALSTIEFISSAALIVLAIFSFIWMWKTFQAVGKPGWWVLFNLVPVLGNIIFLVLLGVAAKENKELPKKSNKTKKK